MHRPFLICIAGVGVLRLIVGAAAPPRGAVRLPLLRPFLICIAGVGVEPTSQGYEPRETPFLYPAHENMVS